MYQEYNDYELLNYVAEKNEDANNILFKKYEPLIISLATKMIKYVPSSGLEINDMIQEGMLGLSNAIEYFKVSKETLFYTYAKTCIERKMIDLVISTRRLKHRALNESVPILDEENEIDLNYLISDSDNNPENILVKEEDEKELFEQANKVLTDLEMQVFELKLNGFEYKEIAEILELDYKKVDNALRRIKVKLKKELTNE